MSTLVRALFALFLLISGPALAYQAPGGGASGCAVPGSTSNIIYNSSGACGADNSFTFNSSTKVVSGNSFSAGATAGYQINGTTVVNTPPSNSANYIAGGYTNTVVLVGPYAGANLPTTDSITTAVGFKCMNAHTGVGDTAGGSESTCGGWGSQGLCTNCTGMTTWGIMTWGSCTSNCSGDGAFGTDAARDSTAGVGSWYFGQEAGINNNGSRNSSVGWGSLQGNTANVANAVGNDNNAQGYLAMGGGLITTATGNWVQGTYSLDNVTSGSYNDCGGFDTCINLSIGSGNNILGAYGMANAAGSTVGNTSNNSGVGDHVLNGCTGACSGNSVIGAHGGATGDITTGADNLEAGINTQVASPTANWQMSIQNAIYGVGNSGTGSTISTGGIGIYVKPNSTPTYAVEIAGSVGLDNAVTIGGKLTTVASAAGAAGFNIPAGRRPRRR